ncbi:EamA family transporter [Flocculibacter collagenilyticus]|uniref:EamA family transporter n=1 Tax=Flocculibacter collagenilyticus TaxID=2744479 RepID=UPI0018F5B0A5|nr:EamA family transporter [Flocculibacter collagenilyticus]
MNKLWITTLLWAFSFSLIGEFLAGQVDGYLAVFSRMILALIVFIPFMKVKQVSNILRLKLSAIGAIQLGLMYLFFYHSFLFLSVPEVLLFTIFTPVYVAMLDELLSQGRLSTKWLLPVVFAVAGAGVIRFQPLNDGFIVGFLLVQAANACFACGQVFYKRLVIPKHVAQHNIFGWFFVGATIISACSVMLFANWQRLPSSSLQWGIVIWLGIGASGLGYFLWNSGAKQVNTGQLAVMNNVLIPAGLLVNLLFWQHNIDWLRFTVGSLLIMIGFLISLRKKDYILLR